MKISREFGIWDFPKDPRTGVDNACYQQQMYESYGTSSRKRDNLPLRSKILLYGHVFLNHGTKFVHIVDDV